MVSISNERTGNNFWVDLHTTNSWCRGGKADGAILLKKVDQFDFWDPAPTFSLDQN